MAKRPRSAALLPAWEADALTSLSLLSGVRRRARQTAREIVSFLEHDRLPPCNVMNARGRGVVLNWRETESWRVLTVTCAGDDVIEVRWRTASITPIMPSSFLVFLPERREAALVATRAKAHELWPRRWTVEDD